MTEHDWIRLKLMADAVQMHENRTRSLARNRDAALASILALGFLAAVSAILLWWS